MLVSCCMQYIVNFSIFRKNIFQKNSLARFPSLKMISEFFDFIFSYSFFILNNFNSSCSTRIIFFGFEFNNSKNKFFPILPPAPVIRIILLL